jgi:hypothetical protein
MPVDYGARGIKATSANDDATWMYVDNEPSGQMPGSWASE